MTVLIRSGGDLRAIHLGQKALDVAHGHAPRIQGEDLVVEPREAPLVLADQPRLERALAIAGHLDAEGAIVGQHRLAAAPVAVIRAVIRFVATRRIAEVMRQLAAQRALDNRLLEPADGGVELLGGNRAPADKLIENLLGNRRQRRQG